MGSWILVVSLLIGFVSADESASYSAPTQTGYGAPDAGYGAPGTGYGTAPSYGPEEEIDMGKMIKDLLPLFLAVFAAILLASLIGPLLAGLLGLLSPLLGPIGAGKASLANLVLNQFGLQLCDLGLNAFPGRSFSRELSDDYNIDPALVDMLTGKVADAIRRYSS